MFKITSKEKDVRYIVYKTHILAQELTKNLFVHVGMGIAILVLSSQMQGALLFCLLNISNIK